MANCIITFSIGRSDYSIETDLNSESEFLNDEAYLKVSEFLLLNPDILEKISDSLKKAIKNKGKIVGWKDSDTGAFPPPNISVKKLSLMFPDSNFELSKEYNILFVEHCKVHNQRYVGLIVKIGDLKIFIIDLSMVNRFANYTQLMKILNEGKIINDEIFFSDIFKRAFKNTETRNKIEQLIDFIENNQKYREELSSEDYSEIQEYLNTLLRGKSKKIQLQGLSLALDGIIKYPQDGDLYINISQLKDTLKRSESVSEEIKLKIENNNITTSELKKLLYEYLLLKKDYHIVNSDNKKIYIKANFSTLSDRYGVTFDTVIDATPVDSYLNYNIYKFVENGEEIYIPSNLPLNEKTPGYKGYSSIEEAKQEASKKFDEQQVVLVLRNANSGDFGILTIRSNKYYAPNSLIKRITFSSSRKALHRVSNYTMSTFHKELESRYSHNVVERLIEEINDPQIAYLFLKYSGNHVNSLTLTEEELKILDQDALKLWEEMSDADSGMLEEYYTVLDSTNTSEKDSGYYTKVVRITNPTEVTSNEKTLVRGSIDVQFEAIRNAFENMGIHVELVNLDSDVKAYVKNGIVYLNKNKATYKDAVHEYVHLFLGMLNKEIYSSILENFKQFISDELFDNYKQRYTEKLKEELSDDDVYEEIFADYYANYISGGKRFSDFINKIMNTTTVALELSTGIPSLEWEQNNNFYDFMNQFFKFINKSISEIGITLPTTTVEINAAKEFISNNIEQVSKKEDTDVISKICK